MIRLIVLVLVTFFVLTQCAPAPTKPPVAATEAPQEDGDEMPPPDAEQVDANTGLYYDQYLQKVVQLLESDENFRKAMETANFDDIKSGKMSKELLNIPGNIRQELDSLKREEITRLRRIAHAKSEVDKGRRISQPTHLREIASHLDHTNEHSFESEDLTRLIQAATKDLENYDAKRHEEFKNYEMNKEMRRQEKLRQMNEEERARAEREYQESRKRHEDHEPINHPGSKAQLNEVWEEEDGLKGQEFNPKTFFNMHDLNNDGYLDVMELEALFEKDLKKVYDENNPDDDMNEREEERRRMREHVMKEVDLNKDGLISLQEFLEYSKTSGFESPDQDSYKSVDNLIDENEVFTDEEFQEFKAYIAEQEAEVKKKLNSLREKAKNVVGLRNDLATNVKSLNAAKIEVDGHAGIEQQRQEIADEEKEMKEMHDELRKQSQEIMELKKEVAKHENLKNPTPPPTKMPIEEVHRQYQERREQKQQQKQQPPPQGGQFDQQQGGQQYQQQDQGQQGGQQPPQDQQYQQQGGQQPPQGQQYQQQDQGQQQYQPPGGQQPPQDQQQGGQQPPQGQQYQQQDQGQQYQQQGGQQPPQDQQYQQQGDQYQQPPQDGQQYQQGGQPHP